MFVEVQSDCEVALRNSFAKLLADRNDPQAIGHCLFHIKKAIRRHVKGTQ